MDFFSSLRSHWIHQNAQILSPRERNLGRAIGAPAKTRYSGHFLVSFCARWSLLHLSACFSLVMKESWKMKRKWKSIQDENASQVGWAFACLKGDMFSRQNTFNASTFTEYADTFRSLFEVAQQKSSKTYGSKDCPWLRQVELLFWDPWVSVLAIADIEKMGIFQIMKLERLLGLFVCDG